MRTVAKFVVLVGILGVLFHGPTQRAQTSEESNADILDILGEEQAELMKLSSWPEEPDAILGFTFEQAAYGVLNGYEQLEEGITVFRETKTLSDGGGSSPSWDEETGTYRVCVARKMVFGSEDNRICVEVVIAPDHHAAKRIMALDVAGKRQLSVRASYSVWGPDFGVEVGQILVLHDHDREQIEDWEGQNSRNLSCVHANVLMNLSKSPASTVSLPSLAGAMVEQILEQEQVRADSGSPLRPTATLSLSQSNIDFPALDAVDDPVDSHSIDVVVDISEWDGGVSKRGFLAEKGYPIIGTTDDGKAQYDESRTTYTPNSDPSIFDDAADPTNCTFHRTIGSSDNSDWHIVIVVWGNNLVPTVAFETVTVVRGQ